ncbi:MAG: PAS domain-containing protein, partial [Anaerolineae bacterium]|nr:PAS domain-containing protein [Anaerolineae bacterium]
MSWITLIWSINAGICLALAGLQLLVWLRDRNAWANLLFSIGAVAAAACAVGEQALMHAQSPAQYGKILFWMHLPAGVMVVTVVWFIHFYLKTGRKWLAWLITGIRALVLMLNFLMPCNLTFQKISNLRQMSFLNETVSVPIGVMNPLRRLILVGVVLFLVYVMDATIAGWKQGNRRRSIVIGGATLLAIVMAAVSSNLMVRGILPGPLASMAFLLLVFAMAFELSVDLIQAGQMSQELKKNQERMSLAARSANLGLWEWDLDRDEIWANEVSRARFGVEASERINVDRLLQSIHPDDHDAIRQAARNTLENGEEFQLEYRIAQPDATERWLEATGQVELDLHKKPLFLRGVTMDITERKLAEEALRKSEHLARILLNATSNLTHLIRADGTILDLNDAMAHALGGSREELIGTNVFDLFPEELRERRKAFLRRVAAEGKTLRFEDADRGRIYDSEIYPVQPTEGEQDQFIIFAYDITERKKIETRLKEEETRLKDAQRIAHIGNWELDLQTNVLTWSDEIFRIFEIDKEHFEVSYESFLAAVHPDDRDAVNKAYKRSLEIRKPYNIMHRLLMPAGRIKYVQERCETYFNPEGKPLRSVGTVQDITERIYVQNERRELRHELAHLNRIMSMNELATSLAHEINQPLGAIMNNAAAAKTICSRSEKGTEEVLEILEDVISDANRAGQIVRKIRGIVKKEDPRREFEILNMNVKVDEAIHLLQSTLSINQVNVHLDTQSDLLPVRGDRVRLEQVIVNLMTNAIEAMKESLEKILTIRTAMHSSEII